MKTEGVAGGWGWDMKWGTRCFLEAMVRLCRSGFAGGYVAGQQISLLLITEAYDPRTAVGSHRTVVARNLRTNRPLDNGGTLVLGARLARMDFETHLLAPVGERKLQFSSRWNHDCHLFVFWLLSIFLELERRRREKKIRT